MKKKFGKWGSKPRFSESRFHERIAVSVVKQKYCYYTLSTFPIETFSYIPSQFKPIIEIVTLLHKIL